MKKNPFAFLLAGAVAFAPFLAYAAAPVFKPIVPLPGINESQYNLITFGEYVNLVFRWSVGIGAILAVLMFIYGGFRYMTSEAMGEKKNGLNHIRDSVGGLLLLISVVLILQVINPCILRLNALSPTPDTSCSPQAQAPAQSTAPGTPQDNPQQPGGAQTGDQHYISDFARVAVFGQLPSSACSDVKHICLTGAGATYTTDMTGCSAANARDACLAADIIQPANNAQTPANQYPYDLSLGAVHETPQNCRSGSAAIPVCQNSTNPFSGTQPTNNTCPGAALKYFCPGESASAGG